MKYISIALRALLTLVFLGAGGAKLAGVEMMIETYNTIGLGQWSRYLTGIIEVGGVVLLWLPNRQVAGASWCHHGRRNTCPLVHSWPLCSSCNGAWPDVGRRPLYPPGPASGPTWSRLSNLLRIINASIRANRKVQSDENSRLCGQQQPPVHQSHTC